MRAFTHHRPGTRRAAIGSFVCIAMLVAGPPSRSQTGDAAQAGTAPRATSSSTLSLRVQLERRSKDNNSAGVVIWLQPLKPVASAPVWPAHAPYTLVQKNKQFSPHLLVVPLGSSVDFPNEDPFFHNVFSLFNGRRFDLGLYEGHTHRAVRFDREGVSYIFCNIHPGMGAVVVSLDTPYFAVSSPDGRVEISGVPAGSYTMKAWAENVASAELKQVEQQVTLGEDAVHLSPIRLKVNGDLMEHHNNKFDTTYPPSPADTY